VDHLVESALAAIGRQDWDLLRSMLHPYVRWTAADGELVRGRLKVLAMLTTTPIPTAPTAYELRDGQIYRWKAAESFPVS
jgi:hypothetical protein